MADFKDLEWAAQGLESGSLDVDTVSFTLSEPPSSCFQETANSINLNISKNSLTRFLKLLTNPTLRNIEFHLMQWELQEMKHLRELLETNPSIARLAFKRNTFNTICFSELSEALRDSKSVKGIVLTESGIGPQGGAALAAALRDNRSLEELRIWEDSIGSKGSEELSKMIELNSSLKVLTIFDSKPATATPLVSAVLARNRSTEVHIWSVDHRGRSCKMVEFAPENSTLRVYRSDVSGACHVACALGRNTTVRSLDMSGVKLKSRWAKQFRWVLEQNQTIREVNLSNAYLKDKGVIYVAAGLFKNRTLEKLCLDGNSFGGIGVEHLLCPLTKFSPLQNQANTTLKSLCFGGTRTRIGNAATLVQMLSSNESVMFLGIHDDNSLKAGDIVQLFRSLARNASLRRLSLQGCKGVKGDAVLQAIIETLNVNPWIEHIDLERTPLHVSGQAEAIYQRLGYNNSQEDTEPEPEPGIDVLKDLEMTVPKCARVFLCGQEYAGKSTLCNSISNNISPSKLPYLDHVRTLVNPVEQAIRIKTCRDEDTKISIWNLAGKHDFYSPHDLMFPGHGSPCLFLIVSSLFRKSSNREPKTPSEIEEDIQYWLRYIVSNSRRAAQQCMLPSVTIVLTHSDKMDHQSDSSFGGIVTVIQRLRDKFPGMVEIYPNVFTVDARSSASVSKLSHHVRKTSKMILERVPRVYQLCNDAAELLTEWRRENHNKPVMRWKEFEDLCQVKVPSLRIRSRHDNKDKVETRRKAVATSLHHIGEVIYFYDLCFLILDCEWFCGEVLSQLTRLDTRKQGMTERNGFVCRKDLEKILIASLQSNTPGMGLNVFENLEAKDLIQMMLKLELCCEVDPLDPNSALLIPSSLEEGRRRPQRWQLNSPEAKYVGRRLQCDDSSHMFLTPGFFSRLQVHMHNKIMELKNQYGASYTLEKYLIVININGIHVRVELQGELGYSIDVLACSTKSTTEMLRLFQQLIIPAIQNLCLGITMMEYVIRSECVKNLIPPRNRRNQFVPLQQLKRALLSVPADSIYDYHHTWDPIVDSGSQILGPGFDLARDLLSDDDFREVLHSRYHDLYNLAMELQVPEENSTEHRTAASEEIASSVDPTFVGIAKGVEAVLQRLKIIEQEIRDVKQEIQGLRYYEHRLLIELHRKVNYLVNYNTQVEERKTPNMFYFVRTENYSRRLITSFISGMRALRLQMLCEYRREMHVVEDQLGCELMEVDNITMKCLAPHMKNFMKLVTFALKIGAHLAAGMGQMIPDLGKEVAHLIDSPMVYGAAGAAAAGAAGVAVAGNTSRTMSSREVQQQQLRAAQQWLIDFLREHGCSTGKDIAEKFGLWRVRYRDDGQITWICRRHMYTRACEIVEAPI
ncbi:protein TORNADO 1 [Salvia hispanica]|uniref:protein TORNADO 1 n=1 Tax=Salvia hispanica TaxID=49212 RepID=UPI0020094418|nr:protein TORNADO 1 [Salvia hispanica]